MNNNLGEKIIAVIREKGINPKPKWTFLFKDYLVWLACFLCLLIGGFAFAVIIYMCRYNNWEVWRYVHESFLAFILATLPYFWLIFLVLFVFLVYYNFKHTKKGYHYQVLTVAAVSVGVSMILGVLFYNFGAGETIDDVLGQSVPFYRDYFNKANQHLRIWSRPEKGLLSGVVVSLEEDRIFILRDFGQIIWEVNAQDAIIRPRTVIAPGERLRIIGLAQPTNIFIAAQIMPMFPEIRRPEQYPPVIRQLRLKMPPPIFERTMPDLRIIE